MQIETHQKIIDESRLLQLTCWTALIISHQNIGQKTELMRMMMNVKRKTIIVKINPRTQCWSQVSVSTVMCLDL